MNDQQNGSNVIDMAPPMAPSSRVQYLATWNGLPKLLSIEFDHDAMSQDDLKSALDKIKDRLGATDLATMVDEQSLGGVARWMSRRLYKLTNGRVGIVTASWVPESFSVDAKVIANQGQA